MWDELRNDPFLRTIAVIVVGILLFGLLFNTVPGGTGMMNSGENMSGANGYGYGYSFNSIIGWLLMMLIRILFIVLIAAVLIGAFIWIRNAFFRDNNSAWARAINNDPILKTVVLVTLAIVGLFILFGFLGNFSSMGYGGNMGYGGGMTGGHMGVGYYGYNPALSINWLLMSLVRVLSYVLIISLAIALAIYLKNQYESGKMNWGIGAKAQININKSEDKTNLDDLDSIL